MGKERNGGGRGEIKVEEVEEVRKRDGRRQVGWRKGGKVVWREGGRTTEYKELWIMELINLLSMRIFPSFPVRSPSSHLCGKELLQNILYCSLVVPSGRALRGS